MSQTDLDAHEVDRNGLGITRIILGVLLIAALIATPILLYPESEFSGSDGLGSEAVERISPEYNSEWITNWWEPPGGETESMLFALQAALGGILIGYFFGYSRGKYATLAESSETRASKDKRAPNKDLG